MKNNFDILGNKMVNNYQGLHNAIADSVIRLVRPSMTKYMEEFVSMSAGADMLGYGLFPNAKEITESFAAFRAVHKHIRRQFNLQYDDERINVVAVGDGGTPRTAATFAFRTKWQCWSVDPVLNLKPSLFTKITPPPYPGNKPNIEWTTHNYIKRLIAVKGKIEDCEFHFDKCIVVCVHSHINLETTLQSINAKEIYLVAIPCCVPLCLDKEPLIEYLDYGIWSPERTVKIWALQS